jgi:hypothetical protein
MATNFYLSQLMDQQTSILQLLGHRTAHRNRIAPYKF